MIDATTLLRSLAREPLTTIQGRTNTVLSVENRNAIVVTNRSGPGGREIPIRSLQDVLDRLVDGETVDIDPSTIGHRSSFLAAVLRCLPQLEFLSEPPRVRMKQPAAPDVLAELERRLGMYADLLAEGGPERVSPAVLRALGIYGGAGGVWVDADRTRGIGGASSVAVGLLHTGRHYGDDLSEDAVIYHYPDTGRPQGRDRSEIEAMKAAGSLRLPVFLVLQHGTLRTVRKGWVATWEDDERVVLVEFGPLPVRVLSGDAVDSHPFDLFENRGNGRRRNVRARPNQQRFKMQVIQRYGAQCAVCQIATLELITAAHLVPDSERGTSDPRNGLPLCGTHHTAFDRGLMAIEPTTTRIVTAEGHEATALGIQRSDLTHLPASPAAEALAYRWERRP